MLKLMNMAKNCYISKIYKNLNWKKNKKHVISKNIENID